MANASSVRRVFDLAYGRSGDKGDIANVSVIARSSAAYAELKSKLSAERVAGLGGWFWPVVRYELDQHRALNFCALSAGARRWSHPLASPGPLG
jgi:hypothetical protein